jgi:transcription initiation factor TFIIIB Brf1 subunit/transcription initiation factor TFIIB
MKEYFCPTCGRYDRPTELSSGSWICRKCGTKNDTIDIKKTREQAILSIIKKIDDKFYGPNTEHDPDEKTVREMYAMAIAANISSILIGEYKEG